MDVSLILLKRQPDIQVLEYQNMVITISLSIGCMCCPPIPPPLSGYSQSQSDTRWQWLVAVLAIWVKSVHACVCQLQRFLGASESRTCEASTNSLQKQCLLKVIICILFVTRRRFLTVLCFDFLFFWMDCKIISVTAYCSLNGAGELADIL